MKSTLVYVFLFALVGSVLCGRLRRQAPAAAVGGAEADGSTPPPHPSTADKLNAVVAGMLLEMNNKVAMGEAVDPKAVDKVLKLGMVINIVGGEFSDENKKALEDLLSAPAEAEAAE